MGYNAAMESCNHYRVPAKIKKVWLKTRHLESFDVSFCKVGKRSAFLESLF